MEALEGGGGTEREIDPCGPIPEGRSLKIVLHEKAWEDELHWQASDAKLLLRLNGLIRECCRTPFAGTGKPEPLRGPLSGWWSRRLTKEHRLVYRPSEDALPIVQCRYRY